MKAAFETGKKLLLILSLGLVMSCAKHVVATQPSEVVIERPVSPGADYVWQGAGWRWDPVKKVYVNAPGVWIKRPGGVWVSGHWRKAKRGYVWVPGHWK